MTKQIALLLFLFTSLSAFAQDYLDKEAQAIVAEGKMLYRSEMASWYGTDLFLEKYTDRESIGGYFSYMDNTVPTCIFFSSGDLPAVIGVITFDSTYSTRTAKVDLAGRGFTETEKALYAIRKAALDEINSDKGKLFKSYENTNLNLVPLINGDEKKVYVLTGPLKNGVVIFGNDYLLSFDKNNRLTGKKQLHKNIIPLYYGQKTEEGEESDSAIHSHLPETGDYITATDICTLMLYAKAAGWKTHNVISEKYLNIWNCETNTLAVISRKALDKINKEDEKRNKKNKGKE